MRVYKNHNRSCIYALFKNEVVVYIGQSINPFNRIGQHTKDKDFDYFRLMPCLKKRLTYWEDYLIGKYDPKYNIQKKRKGSPRVKKKPEVEYECEPLFISEVKANVGYGALVTTGPHLVLDNTAYTAMTYQPNVFLSDSSGSSYIQDFSMKKGLERLLQEEERAEA
jgi:hypothetical protein